MAYITLDVGASYDASFNAFKKELGAILGVLEKKHVINVGVGGIEDVEKLSRAIKEINDAVSSVNAGKVSVDGISKITGMLSKLPASAGSIGSVSKKFETLGNDLNSVAKSLKLLTDGFKNSSPDTFVSKLRGVADTLNEISRVVGLINSKDFNISNIFNYSDTGASTLDIYKTEALEMLRFVERLSTEMQQLISQNARPGKALNRLLLDSGMTGAFMNVSETLKAFDSNKLIKAKDISSVVAYRSQLENLYTTMRKIMELSYAKGFTYDNLDEEKLFTAINTRKNYEAQARSLESSASEAAKAVADAQKRQADASASGAVPEVENIKAALGTIDAQLAELRAKILSTFDFTTVPADASGILSTLKQVEEAVNRIKQGMQELPALQSGGVPTGSTGSDASSSGSRSGSKKGGSENTDKATKSQTKLNAALKKGEAAITRSEKATVRYAKAATSSSKAIKDQYKVFGRIPEDVAELDAKLNKKEISVKQYVDEVKNLNTEINNAGGALQSMGIGVKTFGDRLGITFNNAMKYFSINRVLMALYRTFKDMISASIELNDSMTQLKIVTGASGNEMKTFLKESVSLAKELGRSVTEVMGSIETFSRLGYNLEDSSVLAKYASVLSNVAAVDTESATTGLTSIIKGYNMDVSDAEHVADVLVDVGQKYAVSASELMDAYAKSSAAFAATNTSFEKSAGLIAAANASVQNADVVGTALKTVSARIRGSKSDLEELGESTEDLSDGFSKYADEIKSLTGFNIMVEGTTNEFKDLYDILKGVSGVWDNLSDTQQARVSEILGGTRQLQVISSIIGNFKDAEGAYATAMDSAGVSAAANDVYMQSTSAHIGQMKASFQEFSNTVVNSGVVSAVADIAGIFLDVLTALEKIHVLLPAIGVGIALISAKGTQVAAKGIVDPVVDMAKNYKTKEDIVVNYELAKSIADLDLVQREYTKTLLTRKLVESGISPEIAAQILYNYGFAASVDAATDEINGYIAATIGATVATKGIGTAIKTVPVIGWALAAISIIIEIVSWVSRASDSAEEASKKFKDLTSSIASAEKELNDNIENVESIKQKYAELSQGVNEHGENIALTNDDYKQYLDYNNQLAELSPELVTGYDEEGNALLSLSGSISQVTSSIDDMIKSMREAAATELLGNTDGFDTIAESSEDARDKVDELREYVNALKSLREDGSVLFKGDRGASSAEGLRVDLIRDGVSAVHKLEWYKNHKVYISDEDKDKLDGIYQDKLRELSAAESELNGITSTARKYAEAYFSTDAALAYDGMISKMGTTGKSILDSLVGNIDMSDYDSLEKYTEQLNRLMSQVMSLGESDQWDAIRTNIENLSNSASSISYGDMLSEYDTLVNNLEAAGAGDDLADAVASSLDIEEYGKKAEHVKELIDATSEDVERINSLSLEDLTLAYNIKEEAGSLTFDELEEKIERERKITFTISVEAEKEKLDNLSSAIKEATSPTGLSGEAISTIKSMFGLLEGYDEDILFEKTYSGIRLNIEALNDLYAAYEAHNNQGTSEKIEALCEKYNELSDQIDKAAASGEEYDDLIKDQDSIRQQINDITRQASAYDALTSSYNRWLLAKNSDTDRYDGIRGAIDEIEKLYKSGEVGGADFRAGAQMMSYEDLTTKSVEEVIAAYKRGIPIMNRYFTEGSDGCVNFLNDLNKLNSDWAYLEDGDWYINFDAKDVAEQFGISIDMVEALVDQLERYGFSIDRSSMYDSLDGLTEIQKVTDIVNDAKEALEGFRDENGKLDFKASGFDEAVDKFVKFKQYADSLSDESAIVKISVEEDPDSDIGKAVQKLQAFKSAYERLTIISSIEGIDQGSIDKAKAEVDAAFVGIQEDKYISANFEIDKESEAAAYEAINALTADKFIEVGIDADSIEGYVDTNPVVTYGIDTTAPDNWKPKDKEAVVKYRYKVYGDPASSGGTARVNGTAMLNGNWGTNSDGMALGGELGQELIVRDGHFFTIGDSSAEMFKYKKGDIIFNAEQTKQILKNGRISSGSVRGKAFASTNGNSNTIGKGAAGILLGAMGAMGLSGGSGSSSSSSKSDSKSDDNEKTDWIEIAISRIERLIKNFSKIADSAFKTLSSRLEATTGEIAGVNAEIRIQTAGEKRYLQEANSVGLSSDLAERVRNGTIDINEYDEATRDLIDKYQTWYEKSLACADAVEELHEKLASLYQDRFDNISGDYENQLALIEHLTNTYDNGLKNLEERGLFASASYYNAMRNIEAENIEILRKKVTNLTQAMSDAVNADNGITEGSEAWHKMQQEINDTKEAIDEATTSIIELENSIRELKWEQFDYLRDRISNVTEESDFLIDLLSGKDLFTDKGAMNDGGMAVAGLHGSNYNVYMAEADAYAKELLSVNELLANDPNNQKLIERKEDLIESQQDAILAAQNEKQAIVDLVEEGIEKELESLQKLIDNYTDALDSAKD